METRATFIFENDFNNFVREQGIKELRNHILKVMKPEVNHSIIERDMFGRFADFALDA